MISLSSSILLISFVSIATASFFFAMLGLGGSMVYVPVMKWLGFDLKSVAIPLGLLLNGLTTSFALIQYHKARLVDYKGAIFFAMSGIIGAPIGAYIVQFIPSKIVLGLFIITVLMAAVKVLISSKNPETEETLNFKKKAIYTSISGLFIGCISGMLGIGGGFLIAPILMSMGYNTKKAAATTAFIVTFSSFSGFIGHVAEGHFNPLLTLVLIAAVIPASQLGARFTIKKANPKTIKKIYVIILLLIALKLTLGLFGVHIK